MAEDLLHRPQISATVEQMRRGGVTERVRPGRPPAGGSPEHLARERIHGANIQSPTASAQKERATRSRLLKHRTTGPKPAIDGSRRVGTERHNTFLVALADNPHHTPPQVDGAHVERAALRDADPRRIQQLDDRKVALFDRIPGGRSISAVSYTHLTLPTK